MEFILATDAPHAPIRHDRRVSGSRHRQWGRAGDVLIAALVAIFLILVAGEETQNASGGVRALVAVLAIVQGGALYWRRRHPDQVAAVVLLGAFAYQAIVPEIVLPIAAYFAVASLAAARPPRVSLLGFAVLLCICASNFFSAKAEDAWFAMAVAVGAWALGEAARSRKQAISEEARRAVSEEQARIARELHDVIAHSVSVIVVQAAAADDVFDQRPDQARAALRSIEQSARDALGELRRLLSAVRPDADPGAAPGAAAAAGPDRRAGRAAAGERARRRRPAAGIGAAAAGRRRALRLSDRPGGADQHASPRARVARGGDCELRRRRGRGGGSRRRPGGGRGRRRRWGHGLMGMRERAALLGGTLEAGPLPRGGFRVHARLPLESAR